MVSSSSCSSSLPIPRSTPPAAAFCVSPGAGLTNCTVTWDATFRRADEHQPNAIDTGPEGPDGFPLTVTLALPCFDLPAIRKAVIMIRQYKRLHYGRHEFGMR